MIYRNKVKTIEGTIKRAINILDTYGWTKEFSARDINNQPVPPESKDAVKFCILGSLHAANSQVRRETFSKLDKYIQENLMFGKDIPTTAVYDFNDSCTSKRQVIKVLKDFLKTQNGK